MPGHVGPRPHQREPALGAKALIRVLLALWGALTGAFSGACLLAMAGAFIASQLYGNFEGAAAMSGGWLGAVVGAIVGAAVALWLILRQGGHHGGTAVVGLTGLAFMMVVCFAFVAFSG